MTGKRRPLVVQTHHISYDPEVEVRLFKGEHYIVTLLQRRKNISKGFIEVLKGWISEHEAEAKSLE